MRGQASPRGLNVYSSAWRESLIPEAFCGPAGIRIFAFSALGGTLAVHVGGVVLLATIAAVTAALAVISYVRSADDDPALTTEVGLVLAPLLGGLAMTDVELASGLGVAVAVLFTSKALTHDFVKRS